MYGVWGAHVAFSTQPVSTFLAVTKKCLLMFLVVYLCCCIQEYSPALEHHALDKGLSLAGVHVEAARTLLPAAVSVKAAGGVDARNAVAMNVAAARLGALGAEVAEARNRRAIP